jgi:N-acetylglucosaminyl-diphospho-decaprenol L-rhamnosyltransferase
MAVVAAQLTAVVVHRDRPEALAATVASLRTAWSGSLRVVVVDNASARPPDVGGIEVAPAGRNLGFGGGANVGLRLARTPWVAVCPHDVDVAPGALDRMVDVASSRPRAGLAGADLGLDEVPVVDPYFGGMSVPAVRAGDWAPAGYPHGTLLVARRACLEEVGLFDEAFFAYCEEADLALRARRRGWLCGQVWGADARNTGLGSVDVAEYLKARNTLHLVRRWFGPHRAGVRLALEVPAALRARPSRLAVRDFLLGRWGPPPADLEPPTSNCPR